MKVNHRSGMTNTTTTKSTNAPIILVDSDSGSETDFELDEATDELLQQQEAKSLWQAQWQHLLAFSEDILPSVLYAPMKWCHVSIRDSLKHVAKTEEILGNMGNDTRLLEMQLETWKRRRQCSISKSRMPYSVHLYRNAGDVFYFAFYQNREFPQEIRDRMETLFEAQFGPTRLSRTRSLLKMYSKQFSQIEDFLLLLPEIYRSEVISGLISDYLNPIARDEKGVVADKLNELLSSPDYHENQIILMLLTREDCVFKQVIVDCITKYMITDPQESAASISTSSMSLMDTTIEGRTRYRLKLFLEADPDLLVKACVATTNLGTPLLDIIIAGLDVISVKVITQRLKIFKDFRPPLFGDDAVLSLPEKYFKFFEKMKEAPSTCSLLERVKNALKKTREHCVNKDFWIELFALLNDRNKHNADDSYYDLYRK